MPARLSSGCTVLHHDPVAVAAGGADVTGAFNAGTVTHYSPGCKVGEHVYREREKERSPQLVRGTCRQVHQRVPVGSIAHIAYITRLSTQRGPSLVVGRPDRRTACSTKPFIARSDKEREHVGGDSIGRE